MISQILCIAVAIYFEAANQAYAGKVAIGNVIMNRVADSRYPDEPCEVVHQGTLVKFKCQFTFWCDGKPEEVFDDDVMSDCWKAAIISYNRVIDASLGATHYHEKDASPAWALDENITIKIEDHVFYKL